MELEAHLISLFHRKNGNEKNGISVLDIFAGSGATAQAVHSSNSLNSFVMIGKNEVETVKRKQFLRERGLKEKDFSKWVREHEEEWDEFAMNNGNCSHVLRARLDGIDGLHYDYIRCDAPT